MDAGLIALNRFGLGRRSWDAPPGDAKAWLTGQFARYRPELPSAANLASRAELVEDIALLREAVRAGRIKNVPTSGAEMAQQPEAGANKQMRAETRQFARQQHIAQVGVRVRTAVASEAPFVERLVHFWANHFAVSADKLVTIGLAGLLEFEAIRPNVLGRFEDMLLAVERHPAMLLYLDQAGSVGPNSMAGQRASRNDRKVGLNENLAREILELHTLGVRSGYSQQDVTELARAMTGWSVAGLGRGMMARLLTRDAQPGDFAFVPALHEPGARRILGRAYGQEGEAQARAVLTDLAAMPATARHICTKLARHFVSDEPPPGLVARLEKAWLSSGGDLPRVYAALVEAPEAWASAPAKFRNPWQWGVAVFRALSPRNGAFAPQAPDRMFSFLFAELGQPVWRPGSPAGYDDKAASWAAPDALYRRAEAAGRLAAIAPATVDARLIADALFGARLSPATRETIARAGSPRDGLALLLASPEMLRC